MTALEVIDQIRALPPLEQAKVREFVHQLESGQSSPRAANDQAFADAAKWTFEEHADLMRRLSQ